MVSTPLEQYRERYPNLSSEVWEYFEMSKAIRPEKKFEAKRVLDFLEHYAESHSGERLQPGPIIEICERLMKRGWISKFDISSTMGLENRYMSVRRTGTPPPFDASFGRALDCAVYGFASVYNHYGKSVIPIVNWNKLSDPQIGTCFVIAENYAITARHCVEPASALSVRGVSASEISTCAFLVHPNEALDIALLRFESPVFNGLAPIPLADGMAEILSEVMALGYPNIPGFAPTLAAEAAHISGRLTATRGRVASAPTEIFAKAELILITARVRGGFSGGPVLGSLGELVGMVSREPAADANPSVGIRYDDLGYGTVIPTASISELIRLVDDRIVTPLDMAAVEFRDFEEG